MPSGSLTSKFGFRLKPPHPVSGDEGTGLRINARFRGRAAIGGPSH